MHPAKTCDQELNIHHPKLSFVNFHKLLLYFSFCQILIIITLTGVIPVSYTHLDVYKRQVYGLRKALTQLIFEENYYLLSFTFELL